MMHECSPGELLTVAAFIHIMATKADTTLKLYAALEGLYWVLTLSAYYHGTTNVHVVGI